MTVDFSLKPDLTRYKSFLFQDLHEHNGLLAAGGIRIFQDIVRDHDRAKPSCRSSLNGHPDKIIFEIIIRISVIKPLSDNG